MPCTVQWNCLRGSLVFLKCCSHSSSAAASSSTEPSSFVRLRAPAASGSWLKLSAGCTLSDVLLRWGLPQLDRAGKEQCRHARAHEHSASIKHLFRKQWILGCTSEAPTPLFWGPLPLAPPAGGIQQSAQFTTQRRAASTAVSCDSGPRTTACANGLQRTAGTLDLEGERGERVHTRAAAMKVGEYLLSVAMCCLLSPDTRAACSLTLCECRVLCSGVAWSHRSESTHDLCTSHENVCMLSMD